METMYIDKKGREFSDDELFTMWAKNHFDFDRSWYEKWKELLIKRGHLKVKRG